VCKVGLTAQHSLKERKRLAVKWWAGPKQVVNLLLGHIGEVEGSRITGERWRSGRQHRTAEGLAGVVRRLGDTAADGGGSLGAGEDDEELVGDERCRRSVASHAVLVRREQVAATCGEQRLSCGGAALGEAEVLRLFGGAVARSGAGRREGGGAKAEARRLVVSRRRSSGVVQVELTTARRWCAGVLPE
ncbi:hypothetical protein U1Q18_019472, partial [Sarracenia purpurea var. burkii]